MPTPENRLGQTPSGTNPPSLSSESIDKLREGLATCRSKQALTHEAHEAIAAVCTEAHRKEWTPEQLLVAVKDACYTSPEISRMTITSEQDAFLSRVVTACIKQFYEKSAGEG